MTTVTAESNIPVRLDLDIHMGIFSKAMNHLDHAATRELDKAGIEVGLRELIRIRASQINGCAYCVDTHTHDALACGESTHRVAAVAVWSESPLFTRRERAAFAFTDCVTNVATTHVPDEAYSAVSEHFTAEEIGGLLALIVTINAWNAIGVTTRAWTATAGDDGEV